MILRRYFNTPDVRRQDPLEELESFRRRLDQMLQPGTTWPSTYDNAGVYPAINLNETGDHYIVRAELPGFTTEQLNLNITGNSLTISGERRIADETEEVRYHRRERDAGFFNRVVALPGEVSDEKVAASLKNGVLTVKLAKAEAAKPRRIKIN